MQQENIGCRGSESGRLVVGVWGRFVLERGQGVGLPCWGCALRGWSRVNSTVMPVVVLTFGAMLLEAVGLLVFWRRLGRLTL